jgi:enoyl-CoA hydratase/carnithine racemase
LVFAHNVSEHRVSELVLSEKEESLTRVTLNRPDKYNALNDEMVEALSEAFTIAAQDGTRLLVIRANGKGFSGGFDFTGIEDQTDADLVLRFIRVETLLQQVFHAPFATLSLVQGPCFGAAADLVVASTHRIATPTAKFRMPGLMFGVVLGTQRLAQSLGSTKARHILETTRLFNASEAVELGFIHNTAAEEDWPRIEQQRYQAATLLPIGAQQQMLVRTIRDTRDSDLAALVRSVSEPGIKARIMEYVAEMHKQRKAK